MHSPSIFTLSFLAGCAVAIVANFDQANINLANYWSASFSNLSVVDQSYEGGGAQSGLGIVPNSQPNYTVARGVTAQYGSAQAVMNLNAHSTYGHLSSFYFACYTTLTFVPGGNPCNFTMTARCLDDKDSKQNTFTLITNYNAPNNTMQLVDLTGFYQFYANMGYFNGTGSNARCFGYDFLSVPTAPGKNQFPTGFFLDTLTYSVTTS